jgi:hypothetical protein
MLRGIVPIGSLALLAGLCACGGKIAGIDVAGALGINKSDLGACCHELTDAGLIPTIEPGTTHIQDSVNFNCESEICISFNGSQPYCTRECSSAADCADGFTCDVVVPAMGPPDSGIAARRACIDKALVKCNSS